MSVRLNNSNLKVDSVLNPFVLCVIINLFIFPIKYQGKKVNKNSPNKLIQLTTFIQYFPFIVKGVKKSAFLLIYKFVLNITYFYYAFVVFSKAFKLIVEYFSFVLLGETFINFSNEQYSAFSGK